MRKPARSISSLSRSQTTMLAGLTPACCRRSQMAATSSTFVEMPRPPRVFTFRLTVSLGPTTWRHAAMCIFGRCRRRTWPPPKRASMARSSERFDAARIDARCPCRGAEDRGRPQHGTEHQNRRGASRQQAHPAAPSAQSRAGPEGDSAREALREKVPPAWTARLGHMDAPARQDPAHLHPARIDRGVGQARGLALCVGWLGRFG